jgi:hypothetical protein
MTMMRSVDVDNADDERAQMNSGENDEGDDEACGTRTQVFLVAYLFECIVLCDSLCSRRQLLTTSSLTE